MLHADKLPAEVANLVASLSRQHDLIQTTSHLWILPQIPTIYGRMGNYEIDVLKGRPIGYVTSPQMAIAVQG